MATTSTTPLEGEPLISLSQAASRFPGHRGADRLHPATLTRWILRGSRAVGGSLVRLEAIRIGSRWLTTEAALARFAAALSPVTTPAPTSTTARNPAARTRASRDAAEQLRAMGA